MSRETLDQVLAKMVLCAKSANEIRETMRTEKDREYWRGKAAGLMEANGILKGAMDDEVTA